MLTGDVFAGLRFGMEKLPSPLGRWNIGALENWSIGAKPTLHQASELLGSRILF